MASINSLLTRRLIALQSAIVTAGVPLDGLAFLNDTAVPPTVRLDFSPAATQPQKDFTSSIVTAFDWSQTADDASQTASARGGAGNLLAAIQNNQAVLFRAVAAVLLDELNIVRAAMPRSISSITRSSTTATVTCHDPHGLATGDTVRIHGATLAAYNVTAVVTVTSATVFTYAVAGSPVTPAAGTLSFTLGVVPAMGARTLAQARTAILAKISSGSVDS